jgi:tetratricopeptide (TPR) repeat protein
MEKSWDSFETSIANSWLPPSASAPWFLDLRELFDEDPSAGEEFIHKLAGTTLSEHQLAGLAGYWKAFGDEHIDKAILIIRNALVDTEPGSNARIQLLTVLGAYLVDAGRFEESESTFRKLSEEHDSPIVLNNLAYVVGVYLNKPEEGLVLAREAVMKMPREPSFVDTIATLHQRTGDYKTAAETLEYLLQIDPARATAMSQLSILYSEYLEQPERGVVYAERARSQTPRSPEVLDALGWSYYQTGRTATGEEYLLNSLKKGETMDAYIHLSQVVMSRSEHDKALGYLRMAQELAKDEYSLNRIKVLQDDIRKAKSLLDM